MPTFPEVNFRFRFPASNRTIKASVPNGGDPRNGSLFTVFLNTKRSEANSCNFQTVSASFLNMNASTIVTNKMPKYNGLPHSQINNINLLYF
jgi:hypothetical protein